MKGVNATAKYSIAWKSKELFKSMLELLYKVFFVNVNCFRNRIGIQLSKTPWDI